jgi:hypothetical protein
MNRPVNPYPENTPPDTFVGASDAQEKTTIQSLPIPTPSHARQYRAIGLIEAKYERSEDLLTKGTLITSSQSRVDAVVLGRLISLLKKHIEIGKKHLWVVYPRTKQENDDLHVQIVGIWEPETLKKQELPAIQSDLEENSDYLRAGYFSIRGEVVFSCQQTEVVIVKIKQSPKKEGERPKFFKIKLKGRLPDKPVSHFWDLGVQLVDTVLVLREGTDLGAVPKKKRTITPKFGSRKPEYKPTNMQKQPPSPLANKPLLKPKPNPPM